jgi:phospholipase C
MLGTRHGRRASLLCGTAAALVLTASLMPSATTSSQAAASPCAKTTTAPTTYKHVVLIVMENKTYGQVIGNAAAPYLTSLANLCASATKYAVAGSPSRPNYIAMTSGGVQGCNGSDADPPSCQTTANNIFRQLINHGLTTKSYIESMTSKCQYASSGLYATKHNPWPYYIGPNDQARCQQFDIPLGSTTSGALVDNINHSNLPTFAYIVPNLCNDTHDCSVATGDAWLASMLSRILAGPNYTAGNTAVIVAYDEYTNLPNVWIAPSVKAGARFTGAMSHNGLLRTIEEMLGLPLLGKAATAPSMRTPFNM